MSHTIYIMRHGIAEDISGDGTDASRRLTAEGERKTKRAAIGLKRMGIALDAILSSPLSRAEGTARLVASVLQPDLRVEIYPLLAPGNTAADVVQGLRAYRDARHLMLVGHQPGLGELASLLLSKAPRVTPLPFGKCGVAAIAVESLPPRAAGVLEWFMTPKQLRSLGRRSR